MTWNSPLGSSARAAEICASVFAQLLLNDVANPFALALVDVPSSGKTITFTLNGAGFANNCLLARRLVERGVRFIQLYHRREFP
jgi:hypothetical protein